MSITSEQKTLRIIFVSAILIAVVFTIPWSIFDYVPPTTFDLLTSTVIILGSTFSIFFPFAIIAAVSKKSKMAPIIVGLIFAVIVASFLTTLLLGINTSYFLVFGVFTIIVYSIARGTATIVADGSIKSEFVGGPRDPSVIQRVVMDTCNEEEWIIRGSDSDTYSSACRAHWHASSIPRDSSWIIEDEKGNDISELKLIDYHGIAYLVSIDPVDSGEIYISSSDESSDKTDEYTSMDRGVEFYD